MVLTCRRMGRPLASSVWCLCRSWTHLCWWRSTGTPLSTGRPGESSKFRRFLLHLRRCFSGNESICHSKWRRGGWRSGCGTYPFEEHVVRFGEGDEGAGQEGQCSQETHNYGAWKKSTKWSDVVVIKENKNDAISFISNYQIDYNNW